MQKELDPWGRVNPYLKRYLGRVEPFITVVVLSYSSLMSFFRILKLCSTSPPY